jgi:hypothetical protein
MVKGCNGTQHTPPDAVVCSKREPRFIETIQQAKNTATL